MTEYLTPAELAKLVPRDPPVAYHLDGHFALIGADGTPRYRIQQAKLFDFSDQLAGDRYSRTLGVVTRERAGRFVVKAGVHSFGEIEGGWFIALHGERLRLVEWESVQHRICK